LWRAQAKNPDAAVDRDQNCNQHPKARIRSLTATLLNDLNNADQPESKCGQKIRLKTFVPHEPQPVVERRRRNIEAEERSDLFKAEVGLGRH
jgi:hypothetical protein